jgi:hypothetical protein
MKRLPYYFIQIHNTTFRYLEDAKQYCDENCIDYKFIIKKYYN